MDEKKLMEMFATYNREQSNTNTAACGCGPKDNMNSSNMNSTPATSPFIPGVGPVQFPPTIGCTVYRGFGGGNTVSMGTAPCSQDGCDPGTPRGLWPIPFTVVVPSGPGSFSLDVTTPRDANLFALIVMRVTGAPLADQSITPFVTESTNLTYPKWGSNSTVTDPNLAVIPAAAFGPEQLVKGQNPLPPWVSRYNTHQNNQRLRCSLQNADALVDAVWDILLLMNFG